MRKDGVAVTAANWDGLQQQKFILSLFWRVEVWNQGVGMVALIFHQENPSLSLPVFGGCWHALASLTYGHIILVSAFIFTWSPPLCFPFCLLEDLSFYLGPTWTMQEGGSYLKILNLISAKTFFPNKVIFTGSGGTSFWRPPFNLLQMCPKTFGGIGFWKWGTSNYPSN